MRFNDALRQNLLEGKAREVYSWFTEHEDYNPSMCDPAYEQEVKDLSIELETLLDRATNITERLNKINVDSYGC